MEIKFSSARVCVYIYDVLWIRLDNNCAAELWNKTQKKKKA